MNQGDALTELKKMDSDSIDCVITSPPYWSLRKYDIPDVIFDGVEGCEHEWINDPVPGEKSGKPGPNACVGLHYGDDVRRREPTNTCLKCFAWRGQLGLEPTFELYLKHLLEIFDEVKRVLKPTGTCWVNIGDSYYGGKGMSSQAWSTEHLERDTLQKKQHQIASMNEARPADLPQGNLIAKSLCLIPYRFAIAMIDRGWICRNIIQWHKPNCMPSSAKDRFTVDFEPVFFFVKNKKYWFEQQYDGYAESTLSDKRDPINAPRKERGYPGQPQHGGHLLCDSKKGPGRNRRCVWTISTQPYPESHFATFPEALIDPMIRAGCPKGGTVLDPFCGSGTVLRVAESLGRQAIGIDLGYEELIKKRLTNNQMELI